MGEFYEITPISNNRFTLRCPPLTTLAIERGQIVVDSQDVYISVDDGELSVNPASSNYYPIEFRSDNKLTVEFTGDTPGVVNLNNPGPFSESAIGWSGNSPSINLEIINGSLSIDFNNNEAWNSQGLISMTAGSYLTISDNLTIHSIADPASDMSRFPYGALLGSVSQVSVGGNVDISLETSDWTNNIFGTQFIGVWIGDSSSDPGDQPITENWSFGKADKKFHIHDIVAASTHQNVSASGVIVGNSYNTTNVYGDAIIEDIHAVTSAEAPNGAYAVGAEVNGGNLIFHNSLTIRNISAQSSASAQGNPWEEFKSGTMQEADEAYAISVYNSGTVSVNPEKKLNADVVIENDLQAVAQGTLNINFMNENSHFIGKTFALADVPGQYNFEFSNGAFWNLTGQSVATNLIVSSSGLVNLTSTNDFISLKTDTLSGHDGIVRLKVNGANSDRVYVTGTHEGTHYIDIVDLSESQTDNSGTVLISVGNEAGEFVAQNTEGELFWERYSLERRESSEEGYGTDWLLSGTEQIEGEETTTTATIRVNGAIDYFMWRQENDVLRDRFSELRHQDSNLINSGWARISYGSLGRSGVVGFDGDYQRLQVGYDRDISPWSSARIHTGVAFDYRRGEADFDYGSSDNNAYGLSLYAAAVLDSGAYLDLSLRYAHMTNDMDAFDSKTQKINFDTNTDALSASVEIGQKFNLSDRWFVEPHVKATLGRLWLGNDHASNGVVVEFDDMTSAIGRAGITLGAQVSEKLQTTARASILKEFSGKYRAELSTANAVRHQSEDFDDTWGQFGFDVSYQLNSQGIFFAGLLYETASGDLDDSFIVNAGMRYAF